MLSLSLRSSFVSPHLNLHVKITASSYTLAAPSFSANTGYLGGSLVFFIRVLVFPKVKQPSKKVTTTIVNKQKRIPMHKETS